MKLSPSQPSSHGFLPGPEAVLSLICCQALTDTFSDLLRYFNYSHTGVNVDVEDSLQKVKFISVNNSLRTFDMIYKIILYLQCDHDE